MRPLAVVGSLARDRVDGGRPRAGGAPFYAAAALRLLGVRAHVVTKCADRDRATLLPPLVALGVPVRWLPAAATAAFALAYREGARTLELEQLGEPWTVAQAAEAGRAAWVHAGALAASDFPVETLAALARGRRVLLDGQGLVRAARTGPVALERPPDLAPLRHVEVLKLADEEAVALCGSADPDALRGLDVAEVLVTHGEAGSVVLAGGAVERVPALPVPGADPTGAGDGFAAAYLASRAAGLPPGAAARRATAVVAELLVRRPR